MPKTRRKRVPILTDEEFRGEARGEKGNCPEGTRFRLPADTVSDEGATLPRGTKATRHFGIKIKTGVGLLVPIMVNDNMLYFIAASTLVEVTERS